MRTIPQIDDFFIDGFNYSCPYFQYESENRRLISGDPYRERYLSLEEAADSTGLEVCDLQKNVNFETKTITNPLGGLFSTSKGRYRFELVKRGESYDSDTGNSA